VEAKTQPGIEVGPRTGPSPFSSTPAYSGLQDGDRPGYTPTQGQPVGPPSLQHVREDN